MTSEQGWIILIFLVLGLFVMKFEGPYNEIEKQEVREHMKGFDDSNTIRDVLKSKKIDLQIKELERTDEEFFQELNSGMLGEEMSDGYSGDSLRRFNRCRVVPGGAQMTDLIDLETVKAGSIASRQECFDACDADVRCKQAVHRLSKGSSTCFPMSVVSKDIDSTEDDGEEFETLRCDQGTLTTQVVVGDMQSVYNKYKTKRDRQADLVKRSVGKIEKELRMEDKKNLVHRYKNTTDAVLKDIMKLEDETEKELRELAEKRKEKEEIEGQLMNEKQKTTTSQFHMHIWIFLALVALAGTSWLLLA